MKMLKETKFVLSILNKQSIEENFELFLEYFYGTEITDPEAKREKYFSALNSIQNNSISVADRGINIEENSNNDLHKYLLSTNMMPVEKLTTSNDSMTIRKNIINALDLIKSLNIELYRLINKIVGTIIFSKNGNFSSATAHTHLKIIFLNPTDCWEVNDYAEAIYHEFIHLSIFLEDMVHNLFNRNLIDIDNPQIKSVLRGVNRPLENSFHAAVVSIGIMHFYHLLGNPVKSTEYMSELSEVVIELNKMDKYLTVKGNELLYNINLFLRTKNFQNITLSLES